MELFYFWEMENIILFDDTTYKQLYPLTLTRPVCELRVGILTIREKWELWFNNKASFLTADYLQEKYPLIVKDRNLVINGGVLPSPSLCEEIIELAEGEALLQGERLIVAKLSNEQFSELAKTYSLGGFEHHQTNADFIKIEYPWDIFQNNGAAIQSDFDKITKGRISEVISDTNRILNKRNVFIEEGVEMEFATINAETGPVYIGKNATIMEGSIIRGPFAIGESGFVKMGAKIYGPTSAGPFCKLGGEINNSVFFGYSSKAHDGFLGNSVVGEWCNFGADSNCSNLKNNYAEVRLWDYVTGGFIPTGLQFCGLIMGDHSKCGINTMFNTGTVVGVSANIFGSGFPRNFIPSFTWGGPQGVTSYRFKKAMEVAEKVMKRRNKPLDDLDRNILENVSRMTSQYRRWE